MTSTADPNNGAVPCFAESRLVRFVESNGECPDGIKQPAACYVV